MYMQLDRKTSNAIGQAGQNSELSAGQFLFLFCTYFGLFCVSAFAGLYSHVSQICNGDERISLFALMLPKM